MNKWKCLAGVLLYGLAMVGKAADSSYPLERVEVDVGDRPALQRGAKMFMNYCSGCHSLQYLRYNRMAKDLGLLTFDGRLDKDLLYNNLIFTTAKAHDPIEIAMPKEDARQWFGVLPPDLSLVARVRGEDWLYTYLHSFYRDKKRPFGSNNALFKDVAMPNVLANLQGEQIAKYKIERVSIDGKKRKLKKLDYLQRLSDGDMTEHEFDQAVKDIVTFLVYTAEPMKLERQRMGWWVIGFLLLVFVFAYWMKRDYWREIH